MELFLFCRAFNLHLCLSLSLPYREGKNKNVINQWKIFLKGEVLPSALRLHVFMVRMYSNYGGLCPPPGTCPLLKGLHHPLRKIHIWTIQVLTQTI